MKRFSLIFAFMLFLLPVMPAGNSLAAESTAMTVTSITPAEERANDYTVMEYSSPAVNDENRQAETLDFFIIILLIAIAIFVVFGLFLWLAIKNKK